jgi:hypothetical protein
MKDNKASSYNLLDQGKGSWPARNTGPKFYENYDSIDWGRKKKLKKAKRGPVRNAYDQ